MSDMTTNGQDVRIETDSLGEVAVPANMHWGAQTQRSIVNFPIGGERMPAALIRALGLQKLAAAKANMALGVLDAKLGDELARMLLLVTFGTFQPVGTLMGHEVGNLAAHVKLADAVPAVLGTEGVAVDGGLGGAGTGTGQ